MVNDMRRRQWFILTFIISLAINIFLAGVLLGKTFFHPQSDMLPPMPRRPFMFQQLISNLPPDIQQKIRPLVQNSMPQKRPGGHEFRQFRQVLHQQLTTENVDEQVLRQTLENIRNKRFHFQAQMHETFIRIVLVLNKEEREKLLEAMRHHRKFMKKF